MTPKKSDDPYDISNLEGIGPATKAKLLDVGIKTVYDLKTVGPSELANLTGMDFDKANDLFMLAIQYLISIGIEKEGIRDGYDVLQERESIDRIRVGADLLDNFLHGGIEVGAITEFYGAFGSGKTQICHTLCVMVQKPKAEGGLNGSALYIDTENTFRPERIRSIATAKNMDVEQTLRNVIHAKTQSSGHQEMLLHSIGELIKSKNIKLIIVDSATSHYRAEFLGRGTLADRQQRLNAFMKSLHRIADTYKLAIVITNQVIHSPDVMFGNPEKAVGGNIVAHASTYRISLRRAAKNTRVARFIDSPSHEESETIFIIKEGGIEDVESA